MKTKTRMETQIVFYVDLLGTKELVKHPKSRKVKNLAILLHELRAFEGEFELEVLDDGFRMRPQVSTFSDHIVMSYTLDQPGRDKHEVLISSFVSAGKLLRGLALEALNLDMLIRGGATIGLLHHQNGVVLGPALVEAYDLESRLAIYPRVAVSHVLQSEVEGNSVGPFLLEDVDRMAHFNYFSLMLDFHSEQARIVVSDKIREKVETNIKMMEKKKLWQESAKWSWLLSTLVQLTETQNRLIAAQGNKQSTSA